MWFFLDQSGNASISTDDIDNGSSDNCGLTLRLSQTSFDCSNLGNNLVTLTGFDPSENMSFDQVTVTVVDNIAPTVSCMNIVLPLDENGMATITAADLNDGSFDNCAIASMQISQTSFDCEDVGGSHTITFTATDASGNSSSCTATVEVIDDIAPQTVTQNVSIQLDENGMASISINDINNGTSDACGLASLSLDRTSFDCADFGDNLVTLTAVDVNGNSSSATAIVTVEDLIAPVAICEDITLYLNHDGRARLYPITIGNNSTDNCNKRRMQLSKVNFGCADVGSQIVDFTVTDIGGNRASCSVLVTVIDDIAPNAISMDATVQLDQHGQASITPADIDNGSFDACGVDQMIVVPSTFTEDDLGENEVSLIVWDVYNNIAFSSSIVHVLPYELVKTDTEEQVSASDDQQETTNTIWRAYPNPTRDYVRIQNAGNQMIYSIAIHDIEGKLVWKKDYRRF